MKKQPISASAAVLPPTQLKNAPTPRFFADSGIPAPRTDEQKTGPRMDVVMRMLDRMLEWEEEQRVKALGIQNDL